MSCRREHDIIGAIAGVLTTFIVAARQGRDPHPLELLGAALGGAGGSRLPDVLEPPTTPHHRQFAHSITFGVGAMTIAGRGAVSFQRQCVDRAAQIEQSDPAGAALLRLIAGFGAGTVSGYMSHLAADATTPMSIPLLGRLS